MVIVFADDLTGAAATAALFRQRGRAVRLLQAPQAFGAPDVLVINARTRDLEAALARSELRRWARWAMAAAPESHWSKRVDTTLAGHIRAELEVLLEVLKPQGGVLAPAHPEAGRTTRGGAQVMDGEVLGSLFEILEGLPGVGSVQVGGAFAFEAGRWWIPDVETPEDMARVAEAVRPYRSRLLVVDSGPLTVALAGGEAERVLVVQGSNQARVRTQVARLRWACRDGVEVLYRPVNGPGDPALGQLIEEALARLSRRRYSGVVVGGGLTAEALYEALGAQALEPLGSPAPLVALSRLRGGRWDGMLFATKGGAVGEPDALVRLVDLIRLFRQGGER